MWTLTTDDMTGNIGEGKKEGRKEGEKERKRKRERE